MKYVIHFIGGKEMIVSEDFIDCLRKSDSSDILIGFVESENKINQVVNINNITHIERQDEEGYF
jgi:hypothetical protein